MAYQNSHVGILHYAPALERSVIGCFTPHECRDELRKLAHIAVPKDEKGLAGVAGQVCLSFSFIPSSIHFAGNPLHTSCLPQALTPFL